MFTQSLAKKKTMVLLVMVMALILMATTAFATESGAEVTINPGNLVIGDVTFANLSAIVLDGNVQTATTSWNIGNMTDARGNGNGWYTSIQLAQFKQWDGSAYTTDGHTLPLSSLTVTTPPTVNKLEETSSAVNTITAVAENTALDTGEAVPLLTAAANGGMGSYSVTAMGISLKVPANAYACTYKTTATVSKTVAP
ncbi:MAG: WxL domain-containing protein [Candidatus Limiplasma sp.]|nr:WxL domain-containing protein [Candidatus Limiplasma sp.]